jgi:hypothetical protein
MPPHLFDDLSLFCAVLAVATRLYDRFQIAGILSTLSLFFATLGQRAAHRRRRPALTRSAGRTAD